MEAPYCGVCVCVRVCVCVHKYSPLPGTGGFSWEPTIRRATTTTNMGTLHEPVRDTKNRSRHQGDEYVFSREIFKLRDVLFIFLISWQQRWLRLHYYCTSCPSSGNIFLDFHWHKTVKMCREEASNKTAFLANDTQHFDIGNTPDGECFLIFAQNHMKNFLLEQNFSLIALSHI